MKLQDVIADLKDQRDLMDAEERETFARLCASLVDLSCAIETVSPDQRDVVDELLRTIDEASCAAYGLAATLEQRQGRPPKA